MIERKKWLSWALDEKEHSIAIVKTPDGLYFEESGTSLLIERRCTPAVSDTWKRIVRRNNGKRKLTEAEKKAVAIESNYTCNMCNERVQDYEIDHIEQHALRQNNSRTNLQCLCPGCHRKKTRQDRLFGDPLFEQKKPLCTTTLLGSGGNIFSSYFLEKNLRHTS